MLIRKVLACSSVFLRPRTAGLLLMVLLTAAAVRAGQSVVQVPVHLDYQLLEQLLVKLLFNTPDNSREILHDPTGCNRIILAEPGLGPKRGDLEINATVEAQIGVAVFGRCNELLNWQGSVGFLGRPVIEPGATAVRIEPRETWLIDDDGSRIASGRLWEVADGSIRAFFSSFALDLSAYVQSLGTLLPDVLPLRSAQQLQSIVRSLKLDHVQVLPASLDVTIDFEIESLAEEPLSEDVLSAEELRQWESRWQMMDALLVFAVKHYASATGLQELRSALLEILIDSRYRLRDALTSPASRSNDQVRTWFLESWQHLSPVVRSIALEQEGQEHLLWLSVLTATDALHALDQLGPTVGMDISVDGLRRLARMISGGQGEVLLRYDEEVDPELQRLFQERSQPEASEPSVLRFDFSLIPHAMAASAAERLDNWVPDVDEFGDYLPMVARLLNESSERALEKHRLEQTHRQLFKKLVLATAWQESCWRQYVIKNKRLEPLRSGTGDVGMMQINERVWRGFYDLQKLRWNVRYNSGAGAEVLLDYLVKYALKQGEQKHSGGVANLARASYSAYNGGPSQVSRYRRSDVPPTRKKIDTAFWEKYRHVDAGREMQVSRCLGGDLTGPARPMTAGDVKPVSRPHAADPADAGGNWVLAQKADHFTLQFGAFSKRESASRFVQQEALPAPVYIYPLRGGKANQYLVLHGSYANRGDAEPTKRKFRHLKPWLRRFADLQGAAGS
jgi:hypothetical protein